MTATHERERVDVQGTLMRFAAIDIGSNGMRLAIAEPDGTGGARILHSERAAVRLGHHAFTTGRLDPKTADSAIKALKGFAKSIKEHGVDHVRAVATSAVREATDGNAFKRRVKQQTGIKLHIVDGSEEARLIHRAVRDRVGIDEGWMAMDLGGGSLELMLADHDHIRWCESRPLGTVRLLEAYDSDDAGAFQARLHEHLESFQLLRIPDRIGVYHLIATGGNIEALAVMAGQDPDKAEAILPVAELRNIIAELEGTTPQRRIEKWGFRPDRADVILPAALVYCRVAELFGAEAIRVPGVGVKEGILLDLMDLAFAPGDRTARLEKNVEDGAFGLGRAFRFEEDHHQHVARLALTMFDELQELHGLGPKQRRILHAAALLHDVGKIVAEKKHHKHSMTIIENAQLPGLSRKHTCMAACVARYHRKALPKQTHKLYRDLAPEQQGQVDKLAAILRVADALDKRHAQSVTSLQCRIEDGDVVLSIKGDGHFKLQRWAVEKKQDLFERVFGLGVLLDVARAKEVAA